MLPLNSLDARKPTSIAAQFLLHHCIGFSMTSFPVNHILDIHATGITLAPGTIMNDLMGKNITVNAKVITANLACISPTLAHPLRLSLRSWSVMLDL